MHIVLEPRKRGDVSDKIEHDSKPILFLFVEIKVKLAFVP
jgi:hypothetical protein